MNFILNTVPHVMDRIESIISSTCGTEFILEQIIDIPPALQGQVVGWAGCILLFKAAHYMLKQKRMTRQGIEPRTFWIYTRCSNQLSYPALPG